MGDNSNQKNVRENLDSDIPIISFRGNKLQAEKMATQVTPKAMKTSKALLDLDELLENHRALLVGLDPLQLREALEFFARRLRLGGDNADRSNRIISDPHAEAVAAALAADSARRAASLHKHTKQKKRKRCCAPRTVNDGPSTLKIEFLDENGKTQLTYRRTAPVLTHISPFFNMYELMGDKVPFFSNFMKKIFNLDSAKLVTNWEEGIYGHIPPPDELTLEQPIVAGCDKSGRSFISVMLCNDLLQQDCGFVQYARAHNISIAENHHALVIFQPFANYNQLLLTTNVLKDVWTWRHYVKSKGLKKR